MVVLLAGSPLVRPATAEVFLEFQIERQTGAVGRREMSNQAQLTNTDLNAHYYQ